ncbi:phenazine biosynthesis protein [Parachaetomium inaequale]|uniref:Phenazine biosynthesis protein n=1 Tax=Parachaetomium inaequale TaxID=2588326 RepID=A0AAN6P5T8_9PEZI|nr:phenazine biosynthesis protein [Parachaetomium inaequale]
MASIPFTIVDVFSAIPYKGNPLAVVDARDETLTDTQMKLITRQFNLSETTFFLPPTSPKAEFKLRSFLPDGKEVDGVGHNILGVWWHLAQANLLPLSAPQHTNPADGTETFIFSQELGGKIMPVKVTRHTRTPDHFTVSIRQATPQAHATHPDPSGLAAAIGLDAADIGFTVASGGRELQPQVMSTSTTRHLLVPVSSIEALHRAAVQRDTLLEQLRRVDSKAYGLYLFTPVPSSAEGGAPTFEARFFSPGMSGEDPATGSAAGPLSAYLYDHGVLEVDGSGVGRLVVRQGLGVGRECVIDVGLGVRKEGGGEVVEVDLVGGGVRVAEGRITVPGSATTF